VDDDCDGTVDNGNPGGGGACSTGQLGVCAAGTELCTGGALTCVRNVNPSVEACNGLDDDCDGSIDNGGGALCDDLDVCTADACTAGACVHSGLCGVGGSVFYYRENISGGSEPSLKPVPGVGIDWDQDGTAEGTTGSSGAYSLGDLYGHVVLTPLPKHETPSEPGAGSPISSLDASGVAMAAVGRDTLSVNQVVAGDVTGNGTLSALDASYIARYSVLLVDHFPVAAATGSDWKFLKCVPYGPPNNPDCGAPVYDFTLSQPETGKNFYAVLYGDVTGSWQPAAGGRARTAAVTSPEEQAATARDQALAEELRREGVPVTVERPAGIAPAELSLGGWKPLRSGDRRQLTVDLRNADGILGLDLTLAYDASRIAIVGVQAAGIGSKLSLAQSDGKGTVRIAGYGVVPLSGSGPVLTITVEALGNTGRQEPLRISGVANEGGIPLRVRGRIRAPLTRR
jgi:hypothetical protein